MDNLERLKKNSMQMDKLIYKKTKKIDLNRDITVGESISDLDTECKKCDKKDHDYRKLQKLCKMQQKFIQDLQKQVFKQ